MPVKTLRDIYEKSRSIHAPGTVLGDQSFEDWKKSYITNQPRYTDDDYLSEIEKYKNESWYQNLLTNPWLAGNQGEFSPNLWQQIGSWFGDDSAAVKYYNDLRSKRSQWLSEFVEKMRQQDYDSPSAQVAREKAAGLNPDLAPGSISPGSAAENDQPIQDLNAWDDGSAISDMVTKLPSMIGEALSFAQQFQSLRLNETEIRGRKLDNDDKISDLATRYVHSLNKGSGSVSGQSSGGNNSVPGAFDSVESMRSALIERANDLHLSRLERKRFVEAGINGYTSLKGQTQRYRDFGEREAARMAAGDSLGKVLSTGEKSEDGFDTISATAKYCYELERLSLQASQKSSAALHDYNRHVTSKLDSDLDAAARNNKNAEQSVRSQSYLETEPDERAARRSQFKLHKEQNNLTLTWLRTLQKNASHGDPIASFMLMQMATDTNIVSDTFGGISKVLGMIK